MKKARSVIAVVLVLCMMVSTCLLSGCSDKAEGPVSVYYTSFENSQNMGWYTQAYDITYTLSEQDPIKVTAYDESSEVYTIDVDPSVTYQTMLGIGSSMEESTVNNLLQLDDETREKFLRDLIDPVNGAGMSAFRVTIGTADFTGQEFYTYYDDMPESIDTIDWYNETGKGFSIQKDIDFGITGVLQQILEIADELGIKDQISFIASPWSPPGWMKVFTNTSLGYADNAKWLKGGKLNDEFIDELAIYYTRFVEEYAKLGIPITAMTMQNEPQLEIEYPSMLMSPEQQGQLAIMLRENLDNSEVLKEAGVSPKLWAFDHNFDGAYTFTYKMFKIEGAQDAIDGIAFHDYSGGVTEMTRVSEKLLNADQTVALSERSVWGNNGANSIILYLRNGAVSYNAWVTMLDSNIAPEQWTGTPDPTLFTHKAGSETEYWATPEVYMIGNFARFIRPGYVRIESDYGAGNKVTNVCYMNPEDGTIVGVFTNPSDEDQTFRVAFEGAQFTAELPAGIMATYVWNISDANLEA